MSTTSRSVYERAAKPLAVRHAASPDGRSSGHVLRRTKPGRHGTAWWSDGRARRRRRRRRAGGHCGAVIERVQSSRAGRRKRSASGDTPSDRPTAVITATSERTRERERAKPLSPPPTTYTRSQKRHRRRTTRRAILACAQNLTKVSSIYRTEPN